MRGSFRDTASGIVLRDIDRIWEAEGFAPGVEQVFNGEQRMSRSAEYESAVDWSDVNHVRRAVRVFESVLIEFPPLDMAKVTTTGTRPIRN
jgi:hypothetical protein